MRITGPSLGGHPAQAESALAEQCLQRGRNAKQDTEVARAESVGRNVTRFSVTSRWQAGGEPQERVAGWQAEASACRATPSSP